MSFLAYNQGIKYDIFKLTFLLFDRNEQKTCVYLAIVCIYK